MLTSPSLFLTTRTNSFLGTISPVTMSFLIGILRCAIIIPPQSYWEKSLTSIDLHHQYHYYQLPRHLNQDRKSTRLNSSHASISYAVFCLKRPLEWKRHRAAEPA